MPSGQSHSAEGEGSDRREFPRRGSQAIVRVLWPDDVNETNHEWAFRNASIQGQLFDLSLNGVAFLSNQELRTGHRVQLQLEHPRRDFVTTRLGTVIGCRRDDVSGWKVMCRFESRLSLDEVFLLANAALT